ncbi:prion-like-(Q/N-rich) domain-bearing protein 25 isoform X2 [Rhynchophorus ferrugineus]|uniref:prion-like-(Q/N-rich) domain-bearing protein 25 isoform X2 n=1 Tax=Rhynchophorus ferrugineus TaxID=354439 RepID=UPI003FCC5208
MHIRLIVSIVIVTLFGYVYTSESGLVLERLVTYQRCNLDRDCREFSFCYGNDNANNKTGYCKCKSGYELLLRNRTFYACRKLANYNEECEYDIQCSEDLGSLAKCNNGLCGCGEGSVRYSYDGICYNSVLLGDFCLTDGNCLLENGSAYCLDGRCECDIGYAPSVDKKRCVLSRSIGQNCSHTEECGSTPNSECREVCRCQTGYVISRNGSSCLKAATYFYEPCEENGQCSQFLTDSVCSEGNCTCQIGRHGYSNRCVRSSGIGQGCKSIDECITDSRLSSSVDCVDGLCQCLSGVVNESLGCGSGGTHVSTSLLSTIYYIAISYLLLKIVL